MAIVSSTGHPFVSLVLAAGFGSRTVFTGTELSLFLSSYSGAEAVASSSMFSASLKLS